MNFKLFKLKSQRDGMHVAISTTECLHTE